MTDSVKRSALADTRRVALSAAFIRGLWQTALAVW
jgi:hypothetical protein